MTPFPMMSTSQVLFWDLRTEFATVCVPKQKGSVSEVSDWSESSLVRKNVEIELKLAPK